MSLTSFLKIPTVRAKFTETFPFQVPKLSGELLAPSQTKNYSLIGTAFDYLLRFHIERLNPNTLKRSWVAESGVSLIEDQPKEYRKLNALLTAIKDGPYSDFIKTGKLTESLFSSTLVLAKLDMIVRIGRVEPNLMDYLNEDVLDLKNLLSIVDNSLFKSKKFCSLNPIFDDASLLVNGADADMIIDNTLIDIKTTKDLKFQKDYYHQLIGYYILSKIGNVEGMQEDIEKIGIYFSRYGVLHTIPVAQFEDNPKFDSFVKWFEKEAELVFSS
ncbi:MAG: hypothetical protein K8Q89_03440 [Nitrosarchaeum sp.]|nr:hypothetical protein [Nitrosarchaeum sp.]